MTNILERTSRPFFYTSFSGTRKSNEIYVNVISTRHKKLCVFARKWESDCVACIALFRKSCLVSSKFNIFAPWNNIIPHATANIVWIYGGETYANERTEHNSWLFFALWTNSSSSTDTNTDTDIATGTGTHKCFIFKQRNSTDSLYLKVNQ